MHGNDRLPFVCVGGNGKPINNESGKLVVAPAPKVWTRFCCFVYRGTTFRFAVILLLTQQTYASLRFLFLGLAIFTSRRGYKLSDCNDKILDEY